MQDLCICLKGRVMGGERQRENLPFTGSFPKRSSRLQLDQVKARSFIQVSQVGAGAQAILCCFVKGISRERGGRRCRQRLDPLRHNAGPKT